MAMAMRRDRLDATQIGSLGLVTLGVLLLLENLGLRVVGDLVWPVVLVVIGAAVIWRQLDDDAEARVRQALGAAGSMGSRAAWARVGAGGLFVAAGVGTFLAMNDALPALRQGLLATAALVLGLVLVFGPWWWRLGQDLAEERRERIRADERSTVASHLHDSVLQTLALIQSTADNPAQVVRLARSQERQLRSWLYGAPPLASDHLAGAIDGAAREIEREYDVTVDVVTVGDAPLGPAVEALVLAAREAMVNAAKHSGAATVAVYAEAEPHRCTVFVRDRGRGFDRGRVAPDRRGILDSIEARLLRHGGRAVVASTVGEGTEVELEVPRS